jgi:hypothetical protein
MSTITEMNWQQRSLLFANLAKIAYYNLLKQRSMIKMAFKHIGFQTKPI